MSRGASAGVAARAMAWQLGHRNLPGPVMGASQPMWLPDGRLNVRVELYIDGGWIDITDRVRIAGVADGITINPRGRSDWQARFAPTTAALTINNADGLFSDRNPNSPCFGKLGRNTQLRVWVGSNLRFTGEVADFPQHWNKPGTDVWVPIEAAGIARRLGKGAKPLPSPIYREVMSAQYASSRVAFWPMEDGANSTMLSSPVPGVAAIVPVGTVNYASYSGFIGSAPTVTLTTGASLTASVPMATAGSIKVTMLLSLPAQADIAADTVLTRIYTSGNTRYWQIEYGGPSGSDPTLRLKRIQPDGTTTTIYFTIFSNIRFNEPFMLHFQANPSTSSPGDTDVLMAAQRMALTDNTWGNASSAIAGLTVGYTTRVDIAPNADFNNIAVGHLAVGSSSRFISGIGPSLIGNNGEAAADRIARLCRENNVAFRVTHGQGNSSAAVGPQTVDTLLNLIQSAADVDQGILYEPRDMLGIGYRTRRSLYNQPGVTLDYAAFHLSDLPAPVDDDQLSRNLVTVSRPGGSSATYELETGKLSTLDPPDGIGVYDEALTLNVYADTQLQQLASFLVGQGTVDESRYPTISVNLATDAFTASDALTGAVLALDAGIYLSVANLPAWLPPDLVELLVQGSSEELTAVEWRFAFNCTPYAPYRVFMFGDAVYGRLADDGTSTLTADVSASDTSWSVTTPSTSATWSTADEPYTVRVGGETASATTVTGASSPQTFTVTRSANSVVKAHLAGDIVTLDRPVRFDF